VETFRISCVSEIYTAGSKACHDLWNTFGWSMMSFISKEQDFQALCLCGTKKCYDKNKREERFHCDSYL